MKYLTSIVDKSDESIQSYKNGLTTVQKTDITTKTTTLLSGRSKSLTLLWLYRVCFL
jgi:hypothetical protein